RGTHPDPHPAPPPHAREGRSHQRSLDYERFTPRMRRMRPGCFSLPDRTISSWSAAMPALSTGSPGLSRPDAVGPLGPAAPTAFAAAAVAGVRRFALPPRAAVAPSISPSGLEKLNLGSSRTGG